MHLIYLVFAGLIIGLAISVPLGPIGLITMKRAAEFGTKAGVTAGLAIAGIDTVFVIILLIGLHESVVGTIHIPKFISSIGTLALLTYGIYLVKQKPRLTKVIEHSWKKHFSDTFLLCLANPSTYVSFGAIALLLTPFFGTPILDRIIVSISFFLGAVIWWYILALVAHNHHHRIGLHQLQKIVGILIIILSFYTLISPPEQKRPSIINSFLEEKIENRI